ncbi:MAG: cysteine--tRNA ligase [Proteobacteria bacterium]|nr:MAG: cysteine--tRNA ligase [Pseudomonadota bacterium]
MPHLSPNELVDATRAARPALLRLIGDTPLVPIEGLNPNPKVQLYGKLEAQNPGGSVKDRIALTMIEAAEASGELCPGKTILEATSGNTGIGLAMVAAVKGYPITLAMSEGASIERRKILAALGAEFLLTPAELGTDGAIEVAYELAGKEPERYCLTDQYNNEANITAHYDGTALEIWRQTAGRVTHFVAALGTTGTVMGNGRRLRELNPSCQIIACEPHLGHRIQGLKNMKEAYLPGIYDVDGYSEKVNVDDDAAYEMARQLAKREGLLVGMSSGAAMHVAIEKAKPLDGGVMVVMLPDGGERYLSTPLFTVAADIEPKETRLHFLDSFTRRLAVFEPRDSKQVTMYTCGPTVHALPHLGLYRRIVVADLVRRTVELSGYRVKHVMNVTDLDDRTIEAAEAAGRPLAELTEDVRQSFMDDLKTLGVKPAEGYPKASEHVDDMVSLTQQLVERGAAYEKLRSVYFGIDSFKEYGALSGVDTSKIHIGKTVDLDRYAKDDPRDFTLFKRSTLGEIKKGLAIRTDWGAVRPGWHIECAAMAMTHLGEHADIHVGGVDLIFPHHENEIAICKSLTGTSPAEYWIHSGLLMVDGKKMSRSAGNAVTVRDLLERGYDGRQIRFFLLSKHYRQPLHFSYPALDESCDALARVDECVRKLRLLEGGEAHDEVRGCAATVEAQLREALYDDLNISSAQAAVFYLVRRVNKRLADQAIGQDDAERVLATLRYADQVLGFLPPVDDTVDDQDAERLLAERARAREAGEYERADQLREELEARGYQITDTNEGSSLRNR